MKKTYETPVAEKVEFQYQEQVVASKIRCEITNGRYMDQGSDSCTDGAYQDKTA